MTEARKDLADFTQVTSEKNGFISVSVTDKDKKRVAAMTNAYIEELRTLTKTLAVTEASQRRLFYEDQLKQAKDELDTACSGFQQIQQKKVSFSSTPRPRLSSGIGQFLHSRQKLQPRKCSFRRNVLIQLEHNPDVQLAERELDSLRGQVSKLEREGPYRCARRTGVEGCSQCGTTDPQRQNTKFNTGRSYSIFCSNNTMQRDWTKLDMRQLLKRSKLPLLARSKVISQSTSDRAYLLWFSRIPLEPARTRFFAILRATNIALVGQFLNLSLR